MGVYDSIPNNNNEPLKDNGIGQQGMHDETVDEHIERIAKEKSGVTENENHPKHILSKQEIEEAKEANSPQAITNRYPQELETIGPLFQYQPSFDLKTGLQKFETVDGLKKPVYEKDFQGNPIVKNSAKWDSKIQYDVKRGLEVYDAYAEQMENREIVNEKTIKTDSALIKLAHIILDEAIETKTEDTIIVQYRHFGVVRHFDGENFVNQRILYKSSVDPLITILKAMAGLKILLANSRSEQTNGQIVYKNVNFRVASDSNQYGMFMVLRQQAVSFDSLDQLQLPNNVKQVVRDAIAGKDGLMIVGGPPGSGKTTLMTTGLVEYQRKTHGAKNILSLEQPIETPTPGIIQKDIDPDYGVTWDGAISAALREKPQILRVGETSTRESAQAIVRAANAGIVALTTLHIKSVIETFETLKSLGVEENDIKNSLRLIVYLNRVPKLCPHCRKVDSIVLHDDINQWVKRHLNDSRSGAISEIAFRNPEGCEYCRAHQSNPALYGTVGKVGIYEYLKVNRPMLRIYRKYSKYDMYVLKDKLIHPETIDWDVTDSTLSKQQLEQKQQDFSAGLEYYSIERDILAKLQDFDIDFETAKYLLNA